MTDVRENLGWIIGSILTTVAMVIGWFIQSGIIVAIISLLIGAGISYFVQTKTQKKAWQREYSIKIVETVYGNVYRNIQSILSDLRQKQNLFGGTSFDQWSEFKKDYKYLMVDEKLRQKLDEFLERVQEYNLAFYKLRTEILPNIMNEESKSILKVIAEFRLQIKCKNEITGNIVIETPYIIWCLFSRTYPREYVLERNPNSVIEEFLVEYGPARETFEQPTPLPTEERFKKFWESCLKREEEDKTYRLMLEENKGLLSQAEAIKKELTKRIEEPWKI